MRAGRTMGRLVAWSFGVLFASCSTPRPPAFPPALLATSGTEAPPSESDSHTWIERGRAYEQTTGNFSATVSVTVRDLSHRTNFESHGAIAVHRPDAMRMQMSAAGGITAVDLLAREGHYWLRIAGRDWVRGGLDDPPGAGFPAASLARAFLGFDWDHAIAVASTGPLAVFRAPTTEGHALVTIETRDGTTREIRWFAANEERARVRFAEFARSEGGTRTPRVVLFWQAAPQVSSTITVERRTENPTLPAQTFAPPQ